MERESQPSQTELTQKIQEIFELNRDKRIVVLGTTCTGKSTLVRGLKDAKDMDELLFPQLTQQEIRSVCQTPWTEEIGQTMTRLTRARVFVKAGQPVFGTVLLGCDLIVFLRIGDEELRGRTASRRVAFEDAKHMQQQIEREIAASHLPVINLRVE